MARKKKTQPVGPPEGWVISEEYQISSQITLGRGDVCKIKGERGTFVFKRHVVNTNLTPASEWIDLWGGSHGHGQWRSITPDRLKHIPTKRRRTKKNPQSQS